MHDLTAGEADLWEAAREGDPSAWGRVFDLHRDIVYRQACRWTKTPHEAEDVMALVFLEAWRKRSNVRVVGGSIAAWLLVTTNYVAANSARAARRHRIALAKLPAVDRDDDHADRILDAMHLSQETDLVRAAFARLRKPEQDVLTLCVINEYSLAAAAETLGVPVGTVKSRLFRAKSRLAALAGPGLAALGGSASLDQTAFLGGAK